MHSRLLIALAATLSLVLCEAQFARAGQKDPGNPCSGAPKYSAAKHSGGYASTGGPVTLYLNISVAQEVITKERLSVDKSRIRERLTAAHPARVG
jgi:hypothetical protein